MWTKIFLILLAAAFLVMGVFTYLPYSWLQSKGFAPPIIAENFLSYGSLYWTCLWILALALLILANVILWLNRQAWALWLTFLFFAIFVLVRTWWLNEVYAGFAKENNLAAQSLFGFGILGVLLCIATGVGIFFNQFLVLRMRDRMHGVDKPAEESVVVEKTTEEVVEEPPREENV